MKNLIKKLKTIHSSPSPFLFTFLLSLALPAAANVAKIVETGVEYSGVYDAVKAATAGQTVKMLADSKESVLFYNKVLTLDLNGHVLRANGNYAVQVNAGSNVTIKDTDKSVVHNFKVGSDGLWTLTTDAKTVDFEDLTARPAENTVVAVKGGVITGTGASDSYARGIEVYGTNTLDHVNVIGNKSNNAGAGVYVGVGSGILNGEGCRICGNVSSGDSGGGVMNFSTVNLRNSKLSFNKCGNYGGGLDDNGAIKSATNNGTGTLTDCEVIGNEAKYGGGVHNGWKTILKGTTVIAGNTATTLGGGVSGYGFWGLENAGQVTIDGRNVSITNNTCTANAALNNYAQETGYAINLTGDGTLGSARIGIGQFKNDSGKKIDPPVAVTAAGAGSGTADDVAYFTSDDPTYIVVYDTDHLELKIPDIKVQPTAVDNTTVVVTTNGVPVELVGGEYLVPSNSVNVKVVYTASNTCYFADGSTAKTNDVNTSTNPATLPAAPAAPTQHKHCLCGASGSAAHCAAAHTQTELIWKAWTSTDSLPTTADNWYLVNDVTLTAEQTLAANVNLCLNGKVVKAASGKRIATINSGVTFQLTDCDETTEHNFKVGSDGLWTLTTEGKTDDFENLTARPAANAVVAVKGGALTGGSSAGGGAVYCSENGHFTFARGNIVGNADTSGGGGGVYLAGKTGFEMLGGRIIGNRTTSYGGGIYSLQTHDNPKLISVNISGGEISFNVTTGASGTGNGGGIVVEDYCTAVITGDVRICHNKAKNNSGAIRLKGKLTMLGGEISGNESGDKGGAIYYSAAETVSKLTIGGSAVITGNKRSSAENNVCLDPGVTITVSTTTPLAEGAQIGVTTETAPVAGTPVAVTSNRGEDYTYFTSDAGYDVMNVGGAVKLGIPVAAVISGATTNICVTVADAVTAANASTTDCEIKLLTSCANNGSLIIDNANGKVITLNTGNAGTNLTITATAYGQNLIDVRTQLILKGNGGRITADLNGKAGTVLYAGTSTAVVKMYDGVEINTINGTGDPRVIVAKNYGKCYIYGGKLLCPKAGEPGVNTRLSTIVCWTNGSIYIYGGEFHWDVSGTVDYWAGVLDSADAKEFKIYGGYFDGPLWWSGSESAQKYIFYGGKYTTNKLKKNASAKEGTQIWDDYLGEGRYVNNISETYNGTTYYYEIKYDAVAQNVRTAKEYVSIKEALDEVQPGDTVKLLRDIKENVSITGAMSNTFDLAGNVLKGAAGSSVVSVVGDLTVIDSVGTGAITTGGAAGNAYAGGIYTSGKLTLLGGAVTNCVGTTRAGGVYVSAGTFTVGGTAKVYGNFVNGEPNNVYLLNGTKMVVSSSTPFVDGAKIGVWTVKKPTDKHPVAVTTNRGEDYGYFFSDEEFNVANDGGVVKLMDIPYSVIYDAAGGAFSDGLPAATVVTWHSGCYILPANPTRIGYNFLGWYVGVTNNAPEVTTSTTFQSLKALKAFAKWESTQIDPETPGAAVVAGDDTPDGLAVANVKPTVAYENGNVVIPDRTANDAGSKAIVSIADAAFTPAQYEEAIAGATPIRNVVIPTFVTEIGKYAFWNNRELETVIFSPAYDYKTGAPVEVYVKYYAFAETAITNVTFPVGGTYKLGSFAFAHNKMLKDVWILGDVTIDSMERKPFYEVGEGCGGTTFHLSPKKAADAAFVAALTNGVNNAVVSISEEVAGEVTVTHFETGDPLVAEFTLSADAPFKVVSTNTVSLLYYKDITKVGVGEYTQIFATKVEKQAGDGSYRAEFPKPDPEPTAGYFTVCVGD